MKPEDVLKGLEWLIKTPFWIYMAATIAFGAFLIDSSVLVSWGLKPDFKFFGLPVAFWAIASAALTAFSLLSRLKLLSWVRGLLSELAWRHRISKLSPDEKAFLKLTEEHGLKYVCYPPLSPELRNLRDRGFIRVEKTAPDGQSWGLYTYSNDYAEYFSSNITRVRILLGHDAELMEAALSNIKLASQKKNPPTVPDYPWVKTDRYSDFR